MSLAWGSKFLEYSATALIVDTSPAVFRCPKWADEAYRVQYFAHSQASLRLSGDFRAASSSRNRLRKRQNDLLALPGGFM